MNGAAREAGTAAEVAASRKEAKYADIDSRFVFEPIALETLGVLNFLGPPSPKRPRQEDHQHFWRGQRAEFSFSTNFSFGAAFQCHFAA